jgi:subtilase family serine protease
VISFRKAYHAKVVRLSALLLSLLLPLASLASCGQPAPPLLESLKLGKLRTYLSLQAKAGTFARLLHTRFVIHLYKSRTFYAPATPPKVPSFLAAMIDAITGLDSYSTQPRHALYIHDQGSHVSRHGALDCSPLARRWQQRTLQEPTVTTPSGSEACTAKT